MQDQALEEQEDHQLDQNKECHKEVVVATVVARDLEVNQLLLNNHKATEGKAQATNNVQDHQIIKEVVEEVANHLILKEIPTTSHHHHHKDQTSTEINQVAETSTTSMINQVVETSTTSMINLNLKDLSVVIIVVETMVEVPIMMTSSTLCTLSSMIVMVGLEMVTMAAIVALTTLVHLLPTRFNLQLILHNNSDNVAGFHSVIP